MAANWNEFRCEEFIFENKPAVLVFPREGTARGQLAVKMEYWDAFPEIELQLVAQGFHLAYVQNENRWATKADCDRKARLVRHLAEAYGLSERCVPIGMSCGGAFAVRFAGFYPELVRCLYIDAPVLNYVSSPGKLGEAWMEEVWEKEFIHAYPGIRRYQLPGFTEHPINMTDVLLAHQIPILMVCGQEDTTVAYNENGRLLEEAMEGTGLLQVIQVPYRGHHPHGLIGSNEPIVRWILDHCA